MKTWTILLPINCALLFAQTPNQAPDQASTEVDAALRARVDKFYQAFVSGKYSGAFEVVADEFKDEFIGSDKGSYRSCATTKIDYSENFTKATVLEACKGDMKWHGHNWPVTIPVTSRWKLVNGQWYWYTVKETEVRTPWGISKVMPDQNPDSGGASKPPVLPNPTVLAKNILQLVKIDKTEIKLDPSKISQDEVQVTNGMAGTISISIDNIGQPGLTIKSDKTELAAGEKARLIVRFDPDDPSVQCEECVKRMKGVTTARILVRPTNQVFQVAVVFTKAAIPETNDK